MDVTVVWARQLGHLASIESFSTSPPIRFFVCVGHLKRVAAAYKSDLGPDTDHRKGSPFQCVERSLMGRIDPVASEIQRNPAAWVTVAAGDFRTGWPASGT